jgi:competence ComEA-like helix-hairpin-helix protein
MAAGERRNQLILIAIIGGFIVVAIALYWKSRPPGGPIDINRATAAELERLPEVGPAMAKEIVKGRPYKTVEDLLDVKGIGPKTLEKISPLIELPAN